MWLKWTIFVEKCEDKIRKLIFLQCTMYRKMLAYFSTAFNKISIIKKSRFIFDTKNFENLSLFSSKLGSS